MQMSENLHLLLIFLSALALFIVMFAMVDHCKETYRPPKRSDKITIFVCNSCMASLVIGCLLLYYFKYRNDWQIIPTTIALLGPSLLFGWLWTALCLKQAPKTIEEGERRIIERANRKRKSASK